MRLFFRNVAVLGVCRQRPRDASSSTTSLVVRAFEIPSTYVLTFIPFRRAATSGLVQSYTLVFVHSLHCEPKP
jgi:hypothetical protein